MVVPVPRPQPVRRPGPQRRPFHRRRRAGRARGRRPRVRRGDARRLGAPGARRAARRRREPLPGPDRPVDRLPRRPRPGLAARQGDADHLRRHPGVRAPSLVGADPLQPVDEPAAPGVARPPEHRRHERAVPPRRAGGVPAAGTDRSPRIPDPRASGGEAAVLSCAAEPVRRTLSRRGAPDPEDHRVPWPTSSFPPSPAPSSP